MKGILASLGIAAVLFTTTTVTAQAAPETFTIDPNHTYVLWHINHFGFSNPSGKWLANGTILFDESKPQDSKVDVTIKTATVDTGIPALDEHLRSKAFFDTQQFPTATFVSNHVQVTGKNTADVTGNLTVHGVTKPVTLKVILNKVGINPITNKKAIGFSAQTQIKRSDFNMNEYLPGLGDDIKIEIEAEGQTG